MIDVPIAYAFSAGMLATVNPCGFVMLPAYLSYLLGVEDSSTQDRPIGRALAISSTMAAGFLVVFAVAGALVSAGIRFFIDYVPWATILIGALLIVLGIAILLGRPLKLRLPHIDSGVTRDRRSARSWLLFGISYATVSLSCTLPVFLTVVAGTTTQANLASGAVAFVAYGLGMASVVIALTLSVALAKRSVVQTLRALSRRVERLAGALLAIAGAYLIYYWSITLGSDPGERPADGPARFVEDLSYDAAAWLDRYWLKALIIMVGVVAAVIAYRTIIRLGTEPDDQHSDETDEHADIRTG